MLCYANTERQKNTTHFFGKILRDWRYIFYINTVQWTGCIDESSLHHHWRNTFRENGVVKVLPLGITVTKHNLSNLYLKNLARKIALKINGNARSAAKLEHQKLQIKIEKNVFCDTYTQRHKNTTPFLRKKIFRNTIHPPGQSSCVCQRKMLP